MSKKPEILILVGIPASGKTTYAKHFIEINHKFHRVNRDDIRNMLKLYTDENLISSIELNIIENIIAKNKSVVLDNTNLKESYIKNIIRKFEDRASISFKIFDVDLDVAIERNSKREIPDKLGKDKIRSYYDMYINIIKSYEFKDVQVKSNTYFVPKEKDTKLKECVIFDIDGTLANKGDRGYFDWDKVDVDHLNPIVSEQIEFHKSKGRKIIIFSGRDSASREKTIKWLNQNNLYFDGLYMREYGDIRKDTVVKKDLYQAHIEGSYNVHCIYDDRLQVINMWYDKNLFVFNVNQGNKIF